MKHLDLQTNEHVLDAEVAAYPRKKYANLKRYRHLCTIAWTRLVDMIEFHRIRHNGRIHPPTSVVLSLDGVPESKSYSLTLEVLSVVFPGCRDVYTLRVGYAKKGTERLDCSDMLLPVLEEINALHMDVKCIVADAPQRAKIRNMKQHNGYYVSFLLPRVISHFAITTIANTFFSYPPRNRPASTAKLQGLRQMDMDCIILRAPSKQQLGPMRPLSGSETGQPTEMKICLVLGSKALKGRRSCLASPTSTSLCKYRLTTCIAFFWA